MNTKNVLKALLGIAISAVLIWYAVRDVSLDELMGTFSQANYLYIFPALLFTFLFYWFRAVRWRYMLVPIKPVQTSQLFSITVIGFMVNNILPVRIGEVVRAYILGSRENLSKSLSLATIVVERILDGLTILSFLIPGLLLFSFPPLVKSAAIGLLLFYAGLIVFLFLLTFYSELVTRIVRRIVSPFSSNLAERLIAMLGSFCEGLKIFKTGSQIFWIFFVYDLRLGSSIAHCHDVSVFLPFLRPPLCLVYSARHRRRWGCRAGGAGICWAPADGLHNRAGDFRHT